MGASDDWKSAAGWRGHRPIPAVMLSSDAWHAWSESLPRHSHATLAETEAEAEVEARTESSGDSELRETKVKGRFDDRNCPMAACSAPGEFLLQYMPVAPSTSTTTEPDDPTSLGDSDSESDSDSHFQSQSKKLQSQSQRPSWMSSNLPSIAVAVQFIAALLLALAGLQALLTLDAPPVEHVESMGETKAENTNARDAI